MASCIDNSIIDDNLNVPNATLNNSNFVNADLSIFNGLIDDEMPTNAGIGYYTPDDANTILKEVGNMSGFSIFHINIRSLNANYLKLFEYLT
jgi:hypothetical protein